ncbi:hypothetical protein PTSG_10754 [Salpingoeca rosetta]|uniref:Armadillo repeat-containing protein 1 n=1 Tax=Salpingoeca rosetta (strain ATCC 50818 / BSB-021) TaxID=946362 RepID=F2UQA1_SALR5|nr:uncharacterized protein PTSG_10754 [Salpingoeca rosetta]EGD79769.1 hypothetical protein PTSG_10754 [Salpingoeca rosetta]|eukprot:XP_004988718.1 hypothetical protein PTSG_10754 [Salpingoeca rosetta]
MSVLEIVSSLKRLAEDATNRATIVEDRGCLPGLVLFLDNSDTRVVQTALDTLKLLATCESNHKRMRTELGLVDSLKTISKQDGATAETASRVLAVIRQGSGKKQQQPALKSTRVPLSTIQTPGPHMLQTHTARMARTVVLQVMGMNDLDGRRAVEEELLAIKGVVSFTFDMRSARVTIRVRDWVKTEELCEAIGMTKTMTARQVVRNDLGQEVMLSFGSSPVKLDADGDRARPPVPEYLDEDDENMFQPEVGKHAITKQGDTQGAGWLGAIGGYLAKTFYW